MYRRYQQSTSRVVMLKVFLSSDHVSPATGKTVAIVISQNGGAFANPSAGATNATEIAFGWYSVTLSTTDTATVGDLVVRGTATGCDDAEEAGEVIAVGVLQTGDAYAALTANRAEPGQGTPAMSTSLLAKVDYLYKAWRNKKTVTATQLILYADDTVTGDQKSALTNDGTTATFNEIATGP